MQLRNRSNHCKHSSERFVSTITKFKSHHRTVCRREEIWIIIRYVLVLALALYLMCVIYLHLFLISDDHSNVLILLSLFLNKGWWSPATKNLSGIQHLISQSLLLSLFAYNNFKVLHVLILLSCFSRKVDRTRTSGRPQNPRRGPICEDISTIHAWPICEWVVWHISPIIFWIRWYLWERESKTNYSDFLEQ